MPRRKRTRWVEAQPEFRRFQPVRTGSRPGPAIRLTLDEFEVIRLIDYLGLNQSEAAGQMKVSRHTVGRILSQARFLVSKALVTGGRLEVTGGSFEIKSPADTDDQGESTETTKGGDIMIPDKDNKAPAPTPGTGNGPNPSTGSGQGGRCGNRSGCRGQSQGTGQGRGQGTGQGRGQGRGRGQGGQGQCNR